MQKMFRSFMLADMHRSIRRRFYNRLEYQVGSKILKIRGFTSFEEHYRQLFGLRSAMSVLEFR